jgi:hypothetical protein
MCGGDGVATENVVMTALISMGMGRLMAVEGVRRALIAKAVCGPVRPPFSAVMLLLVGRKEILHRAQVMRSAIYITEIHLETIGHQWMAKHE